jgi:hypothetical protein
MYDDTFSKVEVITEVAPSAALFNMRDRAEILQQIG